MTRRLAPLAAVIAGLALSLTGCADDVADKAAEKSIEDTIEDETGGDADVDIDDDKVKIETSDGTVEAGSGELPDGFPEDDIPVVDGDVVLGISAGGGFQVAITYDGSPADAYADAAARLTGAGLTADDEMAGETTGMFTGNGYTVMVTASDTSGDTAVNYILAKE